MKFGFNRFRRIAMKTSTTDNRCNGLIPSSIRVHCVCIREKNSIYSLWIFAMQAKNFAFFGVKTAISLQMFVFFFLSLMIIAIRKMHFRFSTWNSCKSVLVIYRCTSALVSLSKWNLLDAKPFSQLLSCRLCAKNFYSVSAFFVDSIVERNYNIIAT